MKDGLEIEVKRSSTLVGPESSLVPDLGKQLEDRWMHRCLGLTWKVKCTLLESVGILEEWISFNEKRSKRKFNWQQCCTLVIQRHNELSALMSFFLFVSFFLDLNINILFCHEENKDQALIFRCST